MKPARQKQLVRKKRRTAAQGRAARARLCGSVLKYDRPTEPVIDPREWLTGDRRKDCCHEASGGKDSNAPIPGP